MFRYIIIALALLFAASAEAQEKYSKQLQDSIEFVKSEFSKVFVSQSIYIRRDTLLISQESNGIAGDYTSIPLLYVSCNFEKNKIVFTCNSAGDTVPRCIVREIRYMNDRGSDFSYKGSYDIELWSGDGTKSLEGIAGTMLYVVNAVQKK